MIPDESEKRNDAIDFLLDGMKEVNIVQNDDGTISRVAEFNPDIAWYKGHMINQPFGRCALLIKRVEHLSDQAEFFMSPKRASALTRGLRTVIESYKRSIDAKSSETYKDKENTQSSLIHILSKNKIEKQYTLKGDRKKTFMDSVMGRDSANDDEG
jgi:hypothetical protein